MSGNAGHNGLSDLRALGDNAAHARRNQRLGVTAGAFAGAAQSFLHPELIVIGFVTAVTGSGWLIALVPIINKLCGLAPQVFAGALLEHLPRRRPFFVAVTVVRTLAHAVLVGAFWLLWADPGALSATVFFATYAVCCLTSSAAHVTFMDMTGRLIPPHRIGTFFSIRALLGGVLGVLGGFLVIQPLLGGVDLPVNYMMVAGIGVVLIAIDMSTWSRCREEPGARARRRATFGESLRRGFHWLRTSRNYRLFFWVRLGFRFAYLQLAFLVLFGKQRLPVADDSAGVALLGGIMVGILRAIGVASSALWGPVADRYGARAVVIASGILLMLAPAMLLAAPLLPTAFAVRIPLVPIALNLPICVYLLALVPLEAGFRAQILGTHRFLVTSAPPERRGSYVGFLGTVTSPLTFLPLAGVALAQVAGVGAVFPIAAAGGLVILLAALRMSRRAEADGAADLQVAGDLDDD